MEPGGTPFPLTVLKGGINRLRVKGGANPASLYDLVNAFVNIEGNVQQRDGTIREQLLDSTTVGLTWFQGVYNIFGNNTSAFAPPGYNLNVLVNTSAEGAVTITNASPTVVTFPSALGVVEDGAQVEFSVSSGGALPSPLVVSTVYYARDTNGDVFHIAATPGGVAINTTTAGSGTFGATIYGSDTLSKILFAKPFMGFLYVVAEFTSGKIQHYWLQSSGPWAADTVYQAGSIVLPTPLNGLAYLATRQVPVNSTWAPEVAVSNGQIVEPTVPNGYFFTASNVVGTNPHTGQIEPTWPTSIGGTVQEFGDFAITSTPAITSTTAAPLATSITDRYGDSSDVAGVAATTAGAVSVLPTANSNVTTWAAGTLYPTGSVVRPSTNQGAVVNAIPNGDFENGNDGNWIFSGSGQAWSISNAGVPFQGSFEAINPPGATSAFMTMNTPGLATPGQTVNANCMLTTGSSDGSAIQVSIGLNWYSDTGGTVLISSTDGGGNSSKGGWKKIAVSGVAPATTKSVKVYIHAASGTSSRDTAGVDLVQWDLETPAATTLLLFEAIQAATAASGNVEPTWPTIIGNTVVDGGVTWQAVGTSIITWTASPIMESGASQPTFPTVIGQQVFDGNMSWTAIARNITDPKNPQTEVVAIGASHVFAGDNDITDYSAAVDPTDWSSPNNAGYLPTGLNNYGSNPVAALGLYRGNLIVMNTEGYQMWQIDPDPANMALLDAQPVGCTFFRTIQSVANDLLFLSIVGVRNIGTTGATANLQTGMLGQPIDSLVQAQIAAAIYDPISFYYPARGQYGLVFGPQVFVLTVNGNNQKSWSRYILPDAITDVTLSGEKLAFRTALNYVLLLDPNTVVDMAPASGGSSTVTITNANPAVVTWAGHEMLNGTLVFFFTSGTLPAPLQPGVLYYVVNATTNTFEVSLEPPGFGTPIATTTAGSGTQSAFNVGVPYLGIMQWPYLDLTRLGLNKEMVGFDIVGTGAVSVLFGWDETDLTSFSDNAGFIASVSVTPEINLEAADTLPGQPIAVPLNAPSYSPILIWGGNQAWTWNAFSMYASTLPSAG